MKPPRFFGYTLTEFDMRQALDVAATFYPRSAESDRDAAKARGDHRMAAIYTLAMAWHDHWTRQDKRLGAA
jgi:hypothetical protein